MMELPDGDFYIVAGAREDSVLVFHEVLQAVGTPGFYRHESRLAGLIPHLSQATFSCNVDGSSAVHGGRGNRLCSAKR